MLLAGAASVAASTGVRRDSAFKVYTVEQGMTIAIPSEWTVLKPTSPEIFDAWDRKHPDVVLFNIQATDMAHATNDDLTLKMLAAISIKNQRKKLAGQKFSLVSNKLVRLPASKAARIVFRFTTEKGTRGQYVVYELVHGQRLYFLSYAANTLAAAQAHAGQFARSARSLKFTE